MSEDERSLRETKKFARDNPQFPSTYTDTFLNKLPRPDMRAAGQVLPPPEPDARIRENLPREPLQTEHYGGMRSPGRPGPELSIEQQLQMQPQWRQIGPQPAQPQGIPSHQPMSFDRDELARMLMGAP